MKNAVKGFFILLGLSLAASSVFATGGSDKQKVGFIVGSRQHVFYTLIEKV